MAANLTEFSSIFQENGLEPGKLRMAETGLGWKGDFETKASTIGAADLKWMQWIRVARGFQLRIGLKGEKRRVAYEGFEREDHERLRNAVNNYYNITLEEKDTSVRGWNWGYADIQGDDLAFLVAGKPAFTVPLNMVHNTSITKAEVALEFRDENMLNQIKKLEADRDNKEARKMRRAAPDEMVEMRFYIPGTVGESRRRGKQAKKDAQDAQKGQTAKLEEDEEEEKKPSRDSGSEAEDDEDEDQAAAETFFETIKEKAEIGQVQGETLVSFPDILCTTPRGRFDVDMFPDFLRLRGKTYDYKILYSSIVKLFLLPRTDDIHVQFIINLEPPIRQGQTRYPYLIMQFAKEEEMDAEIQMEENEIQEKYQGKLEKRYEAPAYEVVSSIFRALSGKKVTTPGNFQSHGGHAAVKANFGAMEGHLFFLDKALLYISRNPLYVPYSDISEVRFERVSGALTSGRTFDLIVQMKAGRSEHTFSAVSKEEQNSVEDFLKHEKKLRVKNVMEENVQAVNSAIAEALMDEDSSDDDAPRARGGDDDEDSEVDEDFKAGSDDDDVAEEYDENYSGSSSADSDASSDDDEEEDDDDDAMEEDEPPAKKASSSNKTKSKGSDSEAPAKKKQKKSKD